MVLDMSVMTKLCFNVSSENFGLALSYIVLLQLYLITALYFFRYIVAHYFIC